MCLRSLRSLRQLCRLVDNVNCNNYVGIQIINIDPSLRRYATTCSSLSLSSSIGLHWTQQVYQRLKNLEGPSNMASVCIWICKLSTESLDFMMTMCYILLQLFRVIYLQVLLWWSEGSEWNYTDRLFCWSRKFRWYMR